MNTEVKSYKTAISRSGPSAPLRFVESNFNFVGLRESTVEFVDYDTDGDLDIFLAQINGPIFIIG